MTRLDVAPLADRVPLVRDLDGDGDEDLVGAVPGGAAVHRNATDPTQGRVGLFLEGDKDNGDAVGAVVELRFGGLYRRLLCRANPVCFGLGPVRRGLLGQDEALMQVEGGWVEDLAVDQGGPQVVRITWPNGVTQDLVHLRPDERRAVRQKPGDPGSCPFLYAWDGERYAFVTDVLGTTPLGLPFEEGRYVPPDHDELVRLTGRQLVPQDGEYRLQVTEELRECTYLDAAELWVVDHPAVVEVHPEERFTFPPFPPQRLHAVRGALPLVCAVDGEGRDWTAELAEVDAVHAVPFRPVSPQYRGLVTPHALELVLPGAVRAAPRVRLLMTGWLDWTNASVNVAAGHDPAVAFEPPRLLVPDGRGGWRDTGPPVGFPAGKTKTMVLDVTDLLDRDDPRLRIETSIALYWDAIRVAVDDGATQLEVRRLPVLNARLYHRGFSRPIPTGRWDLPERFEFEALRPAPFDQHQGLLTAYGEVRELLAAADDRFAIFSGGDAVDLRFDARGVPAPEPGMGRTYLPFLDGWAKDGDPNTTFAGQVEPLPFHAMSGYPYGPGEHYPDDAAHAEYRARWNTRPGRKLVPALVPGASGDGPP